MTKELVFRLLERHRGAWGILDWERTGSSRLQVLRPELLSKTSLDLEKVIHWADVEPLRLFVCSASFTA